jgi:CheY-like chemotaxis protein
VRPPKRVLVVEDTDTWVYTLSRAARRAGATDVIICADLEAVRDALRLARFDIAILDVGLDPNDDLNQDGIKALEVIRAVDGPGTQCILVTGWQGGDRMVMQSIAQQNYGLDWAYMKEMYEASAVIAKLTELLEHAAARRFSHVTPMESLSAMMETFRLEAELLDALSPNGGIQTLYSVVSRLFDSVIPVIAMHPFLPMQKGSDGVCVGLYWSRALATAVAVGLGPAARWQGENAVPAGLARLLPADVIPDLIESAKERNVQGWLWELPGLDRDKFAD